MALPFYDRVSPRCGMCSKRKPKAHFQKWYEGRFVLRPFCTECEASVYPEAPDPVELAKARAFVMDQSAYTQPRLTPKATCPGCKRLLSLRMFHPKKVNCALCKECSPNVD